jgi:hypothetical protein
MEDVSSEELMGIQVMALEIIPKDRKVLMELLHRGEELRCVLFAGFQGAARWRPPQGWALDIMDIRHSEVGGVTDARTSFCVLRRGETCQGKGRRVLAMSQRPAWDARCILKMGRPGVRSAGPGPLPFDSGRSAQFSEPGVMLCDGIIPYPKGRQLFREFAPSGLTKYGGEIWVKHRFEAKALLAAAGVPKKLVHLSQPHEVELLLDHLEWPVKMLQTVAEGLESCLSQPEAQRKRRRETAEVDHLMALAKRVHLDPDRSIQMESEADPSNRNSAKRSLEAEEVAGSDRDDYKAKAVKRHDSAVRIHDWDFFLALGLAEEIRDRAWRKAAETIRPAAMRWWKRKQLRKCIKFKQAKTILGEFTEADRGAITDALCRVNATTWWEWKNGCRPFYWN